MLLTVDIGNTNIVFAVFNGEKQFLNVRHSTNAFKTEDEYYLFLKDHIENHGHKFNDIKHIIVASVVPQLNIMVKRLATKYLNIKPRFIGDSDLKINLNIKIDFPTQLGADRIAGSVGAIKKYGNNLILVDFGTATTFDVIGNNNDFIGGVIAPGINTSIKSLHHSTALIPIYEFKKPSKPIPTSSIDALSAGIFYGYIGLVKEIIERLKTSYGKELKVISTGGEGKIFKENVDLIDYYDPDLVIDGLRQIYKDNA